MYPNGYTSADVPVPKTEPYWDPAGEYEPHSTVYTITVFLPPRPPSRYLPSFITREPVYASPHHIIRPDNPSLKYDSFQRPDLQDMKTKVVHVKAWQFPLDLRCGHIKEGTGRVCKKGCYVLEKGGRIRRWRCEREDCEGHVYIGPVQKTEEKWACFGKKGERIAALD